MSLRKDTPGGACRSSLVLRKGDFCRQRFHAGVASQRVEQGIEDFEALYALFEEEFKKTAPAFRDLKNSQYEILGDLWPEMFTSMNSHGPIERGIDYKHQEAAKDLDAQHESQSN